MVLRQVQVATWTNCICCQTKCWHPSSWNLSFIINKDWQLTDSQKNYLLVSLNSSPRITINNVTKKFKRQTWISPDLLNFLPPSRTKLLVMGQTHVRAHTRAHTQDRTHTFPLFELPALIPHLAVETQKWLILIPIVMIIWGLLYFFSVPREQSFSSFVISKQTPLQWLKKLSNA